MSGPSQRIDERQSLWDCIGDAQDAVLQLVSKSDLYALCLVSKSSRSFVERVLYATIEWTWTEDKEPPIASFLRTVVQRPELAACVQKVRLLGNCYWKQCNAEDPLPAIRTSGLEAATTDILEGVNIQHVGKWKDGLGRGTMDAHVALLLSQLHNITHLVLEENFTKETELLGMLLRSILCERAVGNMSQFRYLRHVDLKMKVIFESHVCCTTEDVLPLFYLPHLQVLSVGLHNPSTIEWPIYVPDPTSITSLSLMHVREPALLQILSRTPSVTSLAWEWFYCPELQDSAHGHFIDLGAIFAALEPISNTLKALTITAQCLAETDCSSYPWVEDRGTPYGLARLGQLERLQIPLAFLATLKPDNGISVSAVIPRCIQKVTITDDIWPLETYENGYNDEPQNEWTDPEVFAALEPWLRSWQVSHSDLTSVLLSYGQWGPDWATPSLRTAWKELGSQCGLQVDMISTHRTYSEQ